jgi:hypothetical protein
MFQVLREPWCQIILAAVHIHKHRELNTVQVKGVQ